MSDFEPKQARRQRLTAFTKPRYANWAPEIGHDVAPLQRSANMARSAAFCRPRS